MIDQSTQIMLRQKYNPDGSPLRKHQLKLVEMLKFFDEVCRSHNIPYWLSSGSCLGAVRHGGFIPWDDDLDIEMMREDYLKLESVLKETDKYILQTWRNDRYYSLSWSKLRDKHSIIYNSLYKYKGVFIDVFPMEYTALPISYVSAKLHNPICRLYNLLVGYKSRQDKYSRSIFSLCSSAFYVLKLLYFSIIPLFRLIGRLWPQRELRHRYGVGWLNNIRCKEDIFPLKRISFEGLMFPVPGDYDSYLKKIYGDYTKLPGKDKMPKPHINLI